MYFMSNYYFTNSSLPLGGAFARPQTPTNAGTRARGRSRNIRSRVALYNSVQRSGFVHKYLNI